MWFKAYILQRERAELSFQPCLNIDSLSYHYKLYFLSRDVVGLKRYDIFQSVSRHKPHMTTPPRRPSPKSRQSFPNIFCLVATQALFPFKARITIC